MNRFLSIAAVAALIACPAYAQDISGDWQGTLKAGSQQLRIILHVVKAGDGWNGTLYSIDQGPDAIPVSSVTLQKSNLKFTVDMVHGSYEGKISADGISIAGTWTQGRPMPLDFQRATKDTAWKHDTSPHTVQFVTVDQNVKLEVLDWGGSGPPVVLLAGLGNTAHIFDKFAPKLTPAYHVYGITRRGFGASSAPTPDGKNYSADRLGDDVLAVCHALKLQKPVLIGHSIAGEELSSVGSRYSGEVDGLVYLDAGYPYAYYDRSRGDFMIDSLDLQKKLQALQPGKGPRDQKELIRQLLQTDLPQFEKDLRERQKDLQAMPAALLATQSSAPMPAPAQAIIAGEQKYTDIHVPVLAIYAVPHSLGPNSKIDPAARAAFEARNAVTTEAQAKAFESGIPSARVVRLAHANHYVFLSNEADVLREVNAFLSSLR
jgi:non-heme chloroperoxidase